MEMFIGAFLEFASAYVEVGLKKERCSPSSPFVFFFFPLFFFLAITIL